MSVELPPLTELFPDGDDTFHLTLRRGAPADFFRARDASGETLSERVRWLAEAPGRYAALQSEGEPLLVEFLELAAAWGLGDLPRGAGVVELGRAFEPDILLLAPDAAGDFRLRGGALCFPTGWALEEKLGQTLEAIHGVVPGLNAALADSIRQFLGKLRPGSAFLRQNWGLAATDALNLHPARQIAPPRAPVRLDELWLRVEHQALVALPRTRGVAFGIRIVSHRLDAVARGPAARGLRRALESMPPALAAYKRLEAVRAEVIRLL